MKVEAEVYEYEEYIPLKSSIKKQKLNTTVKDWSMKRRSVTGGVKKRQQKYREGSLHYVLSYLLKWGLFD